MRLAVLSDIHSNLVALNAVLDDITRRKVEGILHLGDLVGYGPRPDETVARLFEAGIEGVVGNYDLAVCHEDGDEGKRLFLKHPFPELATRNYLWTREHTSDATRQKLRQLPAQVRIEEGERLFLFTHGSPERPSEYLFPDVPEERLVALFEGTGADVLVTGHTHLPTAREVGEKLHLNPGSVGAPKDGDPRASYLILDTEGGGLRAENVRVIFDVESVAMDCVNSGLPQKQADALRAGRS